MPLPEADPTLGWCWNAWEIASTHEVDTAWGGPLPVKVWRFRGPKIPDAGRHQAGSPEGCLAPSRCLRTSLNDIVV